MNPYENYYLKQAGNGVATCTGIRYQKGNGFFGRLISGFAMPLLKYFGRQGLEAVGNVVSDMKENPDAKLSDIVKKQAKKSLSKVTDDGAARAKRFIQTGKGVKKNKREQAPKKGSPKSSTKKGQIAVVKPKKRKCKSETFLK